MRRPIAVREVTCGPRGGRGFLRTGHEASRRGGAAPALYVLEPGPVHVVGVPPAMTTVSWKSRVRRGESP